MANQGRPTKYQPEFIEEVEKYLASTGREQTILPTRIGFALWIEVDTDTLVEWGKKYKSFSVALKKIDQRQYEQLVNDGIYGGKEVNSTIVKLLLQNNHGMRERTDLTSDNSKIEGVVLYRPEKIKNESSKEVV